MDFSPTLLRASAGTGKTYQLTLRIIALLSAGESPARILATTFTRKAAGEIQNRLFRRLAEASLDADAALEISRAIEDSSFTTKRASELLALLVSEQHRLVDLYAR